MALRYHIRPASSRLEDGKRFLAFCDTQLPHLAQIGSEGQWGTESLAASEKSQEKYRQLVEESEKDQLWGVNWINFCFMEIEADASTLPDDVPPSTILHDPHREHPVVPIAALILEGRSPDYVRPVTPEQDDQDPFLYIRFLVSNRAAGSLSRGAGQLLLNHAEEIARTLPVSRICLDAWNGNGRMLVNYYDKRGFKQLGDVEDDGWPATVLEKRLN